MVKSLRRAAVASRLRPLFGFVVPLMVAGCVQQGGDRAAWEGYDASSAAAAAASTADTGAATEKTLTKKGTRIPRPMRRPDHLADQARPTITEAPEGGGKSMDRPLPQEGGAEEVAAVPPVPPDTVKLRNRRFDMRKLRGLSRRQVVHLFGPPYRQYPHLTRLIWEYGDDRCQLSIFFFQDLASGSYKSLAWEIRTESDSRAARDACLGSLLKRTTLK